MTFVSSKVQCTVTKLIQHHAVFDGMYVGYDVKPATDRRIAIVVLMIEKEPFHIASRSDAKLLF